MASKKKWEKPTPASIAKALGPVDTVASCALARLELVASTLIRLLVAGRLKLPAVLQAALAVDSKSFPPLPAVPKSGDWLHDHSEAGQPFPTYEKFGTQYPTPHGSFRTVFVQPLGDFSGARSVRACF
jgi:hypothetical protein